MSSGAEHKLRALRERLAAIEGGKADRPVRAFGDPRVDGRLPRGGLPLGRWHELVGTGLEGETAAAPAAWGALVSAPLARTGEVVWVLQRPDLHPPGLAALGLRPIFVRVRDDTEALAAMEDALRARGVAAVWGEVGAVDLTAGRRLQLGCEVHGATGFVLRRRPWGRTVQRSEKGAARGEGGSASATRWRVASAPSDPGDAPGLGPPRWRVVLERCQGGRPGAWLMEASDEADRIRVVAQLADHELAAENPGGQGRRPAQPRESHPDWRAAG
jgi:protein ImuA